MLGKRVINHYRSRSLKIPDSRRRSLLVLSAGRLAPATAREGARGARLPWTSGSRTRRVAQGVDGREEQCAAVVAMGVTAAPTQTRSSSRSVTPAQAAERKSNAKIYLFYVHRRTLKSDFFFNFKQHWH